MTGSANVGRGRANGIGSAEANKRSGGLCGSLLAILGNARGEKAASTGTASGLTNPLCRSQDLAEKCDNLDNGAAEKLCFLQRR